MVGGGDTFPRPLGRGPRKNPFSTECTDIIPGLHFDFTTVLQTNWKDPQEHYQTTLARDWVPVQIAPDNYEGRFVETTSAELTGIIAVLG